MKLSEKIENLSSDFTQSQLVDMFEQAEAMEDLVKAVAHIGVDFGYGDFELNDEHIEKARKIIKDCEDPEEVK